MDAAKGAPKFDFSPSPILPSSPQVVPKSGESAALASKAVSPQLAPSSPESESVLVLDTDSSGSGPPVIDDNIIEPQPSVNHSPRGPAANTRSSAPSLEVLSDHNSDEV